MFIESLESVSRYYNRISIIRPSGSRMSVRYLDGRRCGQKRRKGGKSYLYMSRIGVNLQKFRDCRNSFFLSERESQGIRDLQENKKRRECIGLTKLLRSWVSYDRITVVTLLLRVLIVITESVTIQVTLVKSGVVICV